MKAPHGEKMLAFRRLAPELLKRAYRLLRLATTPPPPAAPEIPQPLLDDCRVLASRLHLLDKVPANGCVAEIGTLRGDFAREILERCRPRELHVVDVTFAYLHECVKVHPNVVLHRGLSAEVVRGFANSSFDWIYIDADHSYEAIAQDISNCAPKVRPGGFLIFNDFARIVRPGLGVFGVHQAVCEFAVRNDWPFAYFCMNGEAAYDVALRRP